MDLPPWNEPSSDSRAALASSVVASVTNPKPRGRPVARSFGRLTSTTLPPVASNSCRRTSSVMESGNPATNNLRESSAIEKSARDRLQFRRGALTNDSSFDPDTAPRAVLRHVGQDAALHQPSRRPRRSRTCSPCRLSRQRRTNVGHQPPRSCSSPRYLAPMRRQGDPAPLRASTVVNRAASGALARSRGLTSPGAPRSAEQTRARRCPARAPLPSSPGGLLPWSGAAGPPPRAARRMNHTPIAEQAEAGPLRRGQPAVADVPAGGVRLAEEVEDEAHGRVGDAHPAGVEAEAGAPACAATGQEGDGERDGERHLDEAEVEPPHEAAARHRPAHREPRVREVPGWSWTWRSPSGRRPTPAGTRC